MKKNFDTLLADYKRNIEKNYTAKEALHISNKSTEDQNLVLYLVYKLVGKNQKNLNYISEGVTYPRTNTNFIHYINFNDEDELILVNSSQPSRIGTPSSQVRSQIDGVLRNIFQLNHDNKTFADKSFLDHYNSLEAEFESDFSEMPKKVIILTTASLSDSELSDLDAYADVSAQDYENLTITIIDAKRFELLEEEIDFVGGKSTSISLFSNEKVEYSIGTEKAVVINLSAKSLKNTFTLLGGDLFDYNLRYYVNVKAQDSEVKNTIQKNPKDFWLFNNGLVVTCSSFEIKNGEIYIENITIVNGAQTTTIIGSTDFEIDFPVLAKVISINKEDQERVDRMTEIAVFANSQKPIKPRDLKANTPEQRNLQRQLKEAGVFMAIKRGEKPLISTVYDWQETTNEELGQILLAGLYQMPGSARSQKSSIFKKNYPMIFKRDLPYPTNYLIDLLKLYNYVMSIDYKQLNLFGLKAGVFANSKLFIISCLCRLLSDEKGTPLNHVIFRLNSSLTPDKSTKILHIESKSKLDSMVLKIIDILVEGYYEIKEKEYPNETYPLSNFTKLDSNYEKYVIPKLKSKTF